VKYPEAFDPQWEWAEFLQLDLPGIGAPASICGFRFIPAGYATTVTLLSSITVMGHLVD
jgi:hypothetical protein